MEKPMANPAFEALLSRLGGETLSFPHPAQDLKIVQTHISIVLLAGDFAYKIKKPVQFPFVDYSTLEKRLDFCQLEVDLNRRLAEDVYLGVVPITLRGARLEMDGTGEAVEYAVKMRRLPDEWRLNRLLENGALAEKFWTKLAYRLTRFYREAARGPQVSSWASPDAVQEDWAQVFDQIRSFPPSIVDSSILSRLESLAAESLEKQKGRIAKRLKAAREGHGDLRLEHIYCFPEKPEPQDLAIIDCVEFNPRYRCADPLCDVAFLIMDLDAAGFHEEGRIFRREYLKTSGEGSDHLLDFYIAYRHLVRGLIRGLHAQVGDLAPELRALAEKKARHHFLLALGKLEEPGQRPCLVLLGGLPGVGKSTLSEHLAKGEGFQVFSSDAIRKELAGQPLESQHTAGFEKGLYKTEWTEKTYSTLLERAEAALLKGGRVLVDASFWRQQWRERFFNLASALRVAFFFFVCMTGHETAQKRLSEARRYGSDADYEIYRKMSERWESPTPSLGALFLNTERPMAVNLSEIHKTLEQRGLANSEMSEAKAEK